MMVFNYLSNIFYYGDRIQYFKITVGEIPYYFGVIKNDLNGVEIIKVTVSDDMGNVYITNINEEVRKVFLVKTDEEFVKKFQTSYEILKFVTDNYIVNIGKYCDNVLYPETYPICTIDFINLLAPTVEVKNKNLLNNTIFEPLKNIFN